MNVPSLQSDDKIVDIVDIVDIVAYTRREAFLQIQNYIPCIPRLCLYQYIGNETCFIQYTKMNILHNVGQVIKEEESNMQTKKFRP